MGHKILYVEDRGYHSEAAQVEAVREAGYEVTHVETGDEAVHRLEKERYDCIVLDIMLPRSECGPLAGTSEYECGLQILKWVRSDRYKKNSGAPVVVVSAASDLVVRSQVEKHPAVRFLPKPFSPSVLVTVLADVFLGV